VFCLVFFLFFPEPSEELFLMFDRLLLLKSGGLDVYFGDLGRRGNTLVSYFEEASGYTELLPRGKTEVLPNGKKKVTLRISPANWMLDVIGAAGQTESVADYAAIWRQSQLYKETASAEMAAAAAPLPGSKPVALTSAYCSGWTRFVEVQHRLQVSHWRNAPMNVTRHFLPKAACETPKGSSAKQEQQQSPQSASGGAATSAAHCTAVSQRIGLGRRSSRSDRHEWLII